jgi:large subunit ribosomal protein L6
VSRIGKLPIAVPSGVKIAVDGNAVRLEGPKGKLTAAIPSGISVKVDGTVVHVERGEEARRIRALHGLTRKLIANMAEGVSKGFNRILDINGVGYRRGQRPRDSYDAGVLASSGFSIAARRHRVGRTAGYHHFNRC